MDLKFQFDSIAELFSMAGHGPYVWACYGVGFLVIAAMMVLPWLSSRRSQKELYVQFQRQLAARNQSQKSESA